MEYSTLDLSALKTVLDQRTRELEATEARLRSVIMLNADGMIVVDQNGHVKFANPAASHLLGRSAAALLDAPFGYPIVAGETAEIEIVSLAANAPRAIAEMRVVEMEWEGALACLASLRDVTERKQREYELETIVMVTGALREANSRSDMAPLILDQTMTLLQADGAALAFTNLSSDQLIVENVSGALSVWAQARLPLQEFDDKPSAVYWRAHWSNEPHRDPKYAALGVPPGIHALASIPLTAQKSNLGTLWVARQKAFQDIEIKTLAVIADIAANALHRVILQTQLEERLRHVQALHAIDTSISASLDERVTLDLLLGTLTAQLNVDAARVLLFDQQGQLYPSGTRGFRLPAHKHGPLLYRGSPVERVVQEHNPVYIRDLGTPSAGTYSAMVTQEGLQTYYGVPLIIRGQVKGVLETFFCLARPVEPEWIQLLQALAVQAGLAIEKATAFSTLERNNLDLSLAYDRMIEQVAHAIELRDPSTEGHSRQIAEQTGQLARLFAIKESDLIHVRRGAFLHDFGMLTVPEKILHKPGPLTEEEWALVQRHPVQAQELLSPINILRPALDIPLYHHERWDGTGYPFHMHRESIPLVARLFAVVETWSMLQVPRPWRPAYTRAQAREFLHAQSGVAFDPHVVDVFLRMAT